MENLEDYMASDYQSENQEIADLQKAIHDVMATFAETLTNSIWPYEKIVDPTIKSPLKKNLLSPGTQAMVLIATGRVLGNCSLPKEGFIKIDKEDKSEFRKSWALALDALLKRLVADGGVKSGTFGDNNPVTISHLSELCFLLNTVIYGDKQKQLKTFLKDARKHLSALLKGDLSRKLLLTPTDQDAHYCHSALVPLRALRASNDLQLSRSLIVRHRALFESSLHDQLSFSTIPDSRFDPAELIFCIEGLLLCAHETVDATLFDRVISVLADKQNTSAHWRPNKPFLASPRGGIILPISVECANSLIRSTALMDKGRYYDTFTSKSLPLIKRFWHWLRARAVRFELNGKHCIGWHSEHVNEPNLIHLWDTSQVTEFLISFKEMLERHMATRSLLLSRIEVKRPSILRKKKISKIKSEWAAVINECDPMPNSTSEMMVYKQLKKHFIDSWASGNPTNYSMLVYGPPGTGKSTIAKKLSEVLQMPLITVTVSDFLGKGGENVEARAKAIFQTLELQDRSVILFDEIDSFLLHRDSQMYQNQDSLFRFLTPGMLTKLSNLREIKRSIFIIATNYADRIDPAIKRTGRIDRQYLLPLPNAKRRLKIMKTYGLKQLTNVENLKKKTAFFGFSDLKGATKERTTEFAVQSDILKNLEDKEPATSINSYLLRLTVDEKFPSSELLSLIALAEEVGRHQEVVESLNSVKQGKKKLFDSFSAKQKLQLKKYGLLEILKS